MLRFFLLLCLAHLSVGDQTINGFVILKGDPPSTGDLSTGCQLDVEVRDVSMMDAPAPLLGSSHQSSVTSFPIQYQVTHTDTGKPTSSYSLSARIINV